MDAIVAPKQSCPRDLGFWYCQNCINRQVESQSEVDFVVPMTFCGTKYGDKVCGETHQGYELCKDCIAVGRKKYAHIGEYETVGEVEMMRQVNEGQYYVFVPNLPFEPILIPNSHHVYPNDGTLMIFDSEDNTIQIYAPGHWAYTMSKDQFEAWAKVEKKSFVVGEKGFK